MTVDTSGLEAALQAIGDGPYTLTAGGAGRVLDLRGCKGFTMIPVAGGTVTYSRVDSPTATAHDATVFTTTTLLYVPADWPFVFVSTATQNARVAAF